METYKFYCDSALHPFIPNKENIKLFFSNIWKILIPVVPTPVIKGLKAINFFNFEYFDEVLVIVTIGCAIYVAFYIGRTISINKEIRQSRAIHEGLHNCRNSIIKIQKILNTNSQTPTISELCLYIGDATLKVFKARKFGDIGVAIRLSGCDESHKGSYSTIYRAGNLSLSREQTHVDKEKGVANLLLQQNKNGCAIFPNIHKASCKEFVRSSNEDKFRDEVKSMIAIPLCVQEGNGGEMIGILHISSTRENAFNQDDVALAKALADMAATMLASVKVNIGNSSNTAQNASQQQQTTQIITLAHPQNNAVAKTTSKTSRRLTAKGKRRR